MIEFASRMLACAALAAAVSLLAAQKSDASRTMEASAKPPAEIPQSDASSKVYLPSDITPESVREARARASIQEQITNDREQAQLRQLTDREQERTASSQITDADADEALAQLSETEREVLLDAVEGTDICAREPGSAIIRKLCAERIETRSSEFGARRTNVLSAEERLLGEGLESERTNSLERAVDRLGRSARDTDDPANQAIASVAFSPEITMSNAGDDAARPSGAGELSPETQALVDAIVQQFSGSGSPP